MVSMSQFRNGLVLKIDGELYQIISYQHVKPGKGGAFMRTRMKNLKQGTTIDRTIRENEKFEDAYIDTSSAEYLYQDGNSYVFMDQNTFEQLSFDKEQIGGAMNFIVENMKVNLRMHGSDLIEVQLPASVLLKVTSTEPGLKGDTAVGGNKPAVLETGLTVQVPLFINQDDVLKIDTRMGEYLSRA